MSSFFRKTVGAIALFALAQISVGCATYRMAKEIRLIGFEDEVHKGKSVGQVEGGDCVFHIFGYWLGGAPTLSRAVQNTRMMRTSSVGDVVGGKIEGGDALRYINNMTVNNDGFNAVVFGKNCIMVSGIGYK